MLYSEHLICLDTGRNGEGLDYKRLVDALKKRFVPDAGQQELRFQQRVQEAAETLMDLRVSGNKKWPST